MWTPNLRPVIATCWLLSQFVNGDPLPKDAISNITIVPPLVSGVSQYVIKWDDSEPGMVFVAAIYLLQVTTIMEMPRTATITISPLPTCPTSNTGCLSVTLTSDYNPNASVSLATSVDSTNSYRLQIQYATTSVLAIPPPGDVLITFTTNLSPTTALVIATPAIASSGASHIPGGAGVTSGNNVSIASSSGILSTGPSSTSSSTPTVAAATPESSSGLSTGAKVGIAIGAVGFVLLLLIAALLFWRRRKQRQIRASSNGVPYTHDLSSTNRDLTAEKEANVMSSPVGLYTPTDTWHTGMTAVSETPATGPAQTRSQTQSWAGPGEHAVPYNDDAAGPYADDQRTSVHSPTAHEDPASQFQAASAVGPAVPRKPVGTVGGPTQHLREPGMSNEEVARLEEEERRLDEAIAEAERRREQQR